MKLKYVMSEPIKFKHPRVDWTVLIELKGRNHKYSIKINGKPIEELEKSHMLTADVGRVRKSTIKVYDNDTLM